MWLPRKLSGNSTLRSRRGEYLLPGNLFLRESTFPRYKCYVEQMHIENAPDQPTEQVELLGVVVAQEFERVIEEMFSLMLAEPNEAPVRDQSAPRTRAAGK